MFSDIIGFETKQFKRIKKIINDIDISYNETDRLQIVKFLNFDVDIEKLALRSKELTDYFFGKTILLYTPLYISNYCINGCLYCGFSALNKIKRKKLSLNDVKKEIISIKEKGFDTILILTGEDRRNSSLEYILKVIEIAKKYFSEILIEIYPLEEYEYRKLVNNGITGVTLYQETYDKKFYDRIHKFGPKKNFNYRLDAVERAINAGVKEVNIGPLLGLNKNYDFDVYMTVIHGQYIQNNYPEVELAISYPRIQSSVSKIKTYPVKDIDFAKIIFITRLFLNRVGINISTREPQYMRDNLIGLGITKMSAEAKTTVGGHAKNFYDAKQFEINDNRNLVDIIKVLKLKNYRPEFTNWVKI